MSTFGCHDVIIEVKNTVHYKNIRMCSVGGKTVEQWQVVIIDVER